MCVDFIEVPFFSTEHLDKIVHTFQTGSEMTFFDVFKGVRYESAIIPNFRFRREGGGPVNRQLGKSLPVKCARFLLGLFYVILDENGVQQPFSTLSRRIETLWDRKVNS